MNLAPTIAITGHRRERYRKSNVTDAWFLRRRKDGLPIS